MTAPPMTVGVIHMGIYRSITDTGITRGEFAPTLSPESLAGAVIALADAYGLQVVVAEPNMTKATAHAEISRVVADLLRFSIEDHQVNSTEDSGTSGRPDQPLSRQ